MKSDEINNRRIDPQIELLWNYSRLNQRISKADIILGLGSHDKLVAERSAELYLKGYGKKIIFSGGYGKITSHLWHAPEAEVFANIAVEKGVPRRSIIIENRSKTTAENIKFTINLIHSKRLKISSLIIVTKPYMERRVYGMVKKQLSYKNVIVTSPAITYREYLKKIPISKNEMISLMVGDLQRVIEFPKMGYSIYQRVPKKVQLAFEVLRALGFTKHLLKE